MPTAAQPQYTRYSFISCVLRLVYCCQKLPQYTSHSTQGIKSILYIAATVHELNYILACVLRQPQSSLLRRRSLPWLVKFSLPQRGNWSHFIRSLFLVKNFALFFAYKEQCFVLIYFLAVRLLKYDLSDILSTARM